MRLRDLLLVIAVISTAVLVIVNCTTHEIEKRQASPIRGERRLPLRARRIRPIANEPQVASPEDVRDEPRTFPPPPPSPQLQVTQPKDDTSDVEIETPSPARRPPLRAGRGRNRLGKRPPVSSTPSQAPLEPLEQAASTTEAQTALVVSPRIGPQNTARRSRVLSLPRESTEETPKEPQLPIPVPNRPPSSFRRPRPQAEEPLEDRSSNDSPPIRSGIRRARPQFSAPTPVLVPFEEEHEPTTSKPQESPQRQRRPQSRPQQFLPPSAEERNSFRNERPPEESQPIRSSSTFRRGRPQQPSFPPQETQIEEIPQEIPSRAQQTTSRRRQQVAPPEDQLHEAAEEESAKAYSPPPRRSRPQPFSLDPPPTQEFQPQYSTINRGRSSSSQRGSQFAQNEPAQQAPPSSPQRTSGTFARSRPQFPVGSFDDGPVEEEFQIPAARPPASNTQRFRNPQPLNSFPIEPPQYDDEELEEQKITKPPSRSRTPQLQPQESTIGQTSPPSQSIAPKIVPASRPGSTRRFTGRPAVPFPFPSPPPIAGQPIGSPQQQAASASTRRTTTTTTTTTTRAPPRTTSTTTTTTTTPKPAVRKDLPKRTDGRVIDYLSDPNFPRELTGVDLTDYPFYTQLPDDITFTCDGRHDGYYASVPHFCQVFHYCSRNVRYDFLCANYTLFDQTTFTCRFVNFVQCDVAEQHYDRNNELYVETTTIPEEEQQEEPEPEKKKKPAPSRSRSRSRSRQRNRPKNRRTTTTTTTTTTEPPYEDEYDDYYEDEEEKK